ncbi:MAG: hypothetical protein J6C96_07965 [Oscillospiraceae bacterium]|nr:hypothetical protein [Oscillospiraceae bacterium]
MQEITKEQCIERINDHERLYLVTTDDHNICLKADIEYGGEIGIRIELMDFMLDTSLTFWNACNECRCRYTGEICFIEYDTYEEAKQNIIIDFLNLSPNAIYLFCKDNEIQVAADNYSNQNIYILTY